MALDVRPYIGVPYKSRGRDRSGLDCWGLVKLIYKEHLGIELPEFMYAHAEHLDDIHRAMDSAGDIREVVRVQKPREYTVVMLRVMNVPSHVGLMLNADQFIHASVGKMVSVDSLSSVRWRDRILGFYEWQTTS